PCFGPDDERLLTAFSAQAAVALEKADVFQKTQEMKLFLQAVLSSITNCVITLSDTMRMTTMNRPWVMETLGVSEQFMREQPIEQWLADTNPHLLKDVKQVYKSNQATYTSEYELKGPSGSTFVNYNIMPLQTLTGVGGGKGVVLVFENISSEKRAIMTLGRYMNPALVKQVMQEGGTQLGGVRKKVAILFSDIRSFTTISESLEPHEVVALLNHHFNDAVNAIMAEQGILDKYIGDAVMAVFGVPFVSPEDSIHACAAALRMKEALRISNDARMAAGQKIIKIGIGINTGEVLSGNIGSEKRLEFSCIGDAVNLASRVEGLTKYYGVSILVTEFTKADSADAFFMREVDTVVVVGKKKPIRLFEVVARRGEEKALPYEQLRTFDLYVEGLKLYRNRKFQEASERFTRAIDLTNDGPSKTLLNRCKHYLVDPPADDWNGVWTSTEK
ncbi:adenylyl cyclase, partial [Gonapodya prolifera JEL478]